MSKISHAMQLPRRLLAMLKQYWAFFVFGLLAIIVLSASDALLAWLIKPIVNHAFIQRDRWFIHWLPVVVIVMFIARAAASFSASYFVNRVARSVVMDFRCLLFKHMQRMPASYFDSTSSAKILSTLLYNIEQIAQASSDVMLTLLRESSLLVSLCVVLFYLSWRLTLLFMLVVPPLYWLVKKVSVRLRRLSHDVQQRLAEVSSIASQGVEGFREVRAYGGQRHMIDQFVTAAHLNKQKELKVVVTNSLTTAFIQVLLALPLAGVLYAAVNIGISAGGFAAIVSALVMIIRPIRRLSTVNSLVQKGLAGAESIFALLDSEPEPDHGGMQSSLPVAGDIVFDQVCFQYPATTTSAVSKISFTVKKGQTVAIVGASGAGKSTIFQLLMRFYDADSGTITIDGCDIRDWCLADLREHFSMVMQRTVLFGDTVAHNIAYPHTNDEIDHMRLRSAAEAALCLPFIEQLPQGFDTQIGEGGLKLSGGQAQRLAIARALYKQAPILLLDEATASLDSESEQLIQQAMEALMQRTTTMVIAHRLSTIENADLIIVMHLGRVVEVGTHADLIAMDGAYTKLYAAQFSCRSA